MQNDIAIKVEHVSKRYCKSLKRSMFYGIKDIARNMLGLSSHSDDLRPSEFWALDDVSFEVKKGETLGIVGPNGAGKTTLLKLLNGIFWPDKGKITVNGRVGALIEVGAGFHPLLTGRENIYINGAILGMNKKEIDKKFDSIVEFADIGDFLDVPVKHYSSGMYVRLGFAVAVHCEPDIFLIDEILAVGDVDFQNKCLNKMEEIRSYTSTIIISHNMSNIKIMCDECLFLQNGRLQIIGEPSKIIEAYSKHSFNTVKNSFNSENLDIEILNENHINVSKLIIDHKYIFKFTMKNLFFEKCFLAAFSFVNLANNYSHRIEIKDYSKIVGKVDYLTFTLTFDRFTLPPGSYTIRFAASDGSFIKRIFYIERTLVFDVLDESNEYLNPLFSVPLIEIR